MSTARPQRPDRAAHVRADQIRSGDRTALAKAITLVESTRADHRAEALELLGLLAPDTGRAIRVGISGTPGVGKSTFIETFGLHLVAPELNRTIAVLAVDPSSRRTGGSILGDKTRMAELARSPRTFIRPSPSAGTLGGVARRTREVLLLCEAAGYDTVLVETVGVGQSETAVAKLTDIFVLLVAPAGGDELQGVKRGVMELADIVAVNKCDGDLTTQAMATLSDYQSALHLTRRDADGEPSARTISARTGLGMAEMWEDITDRHRSLIERGRLIAKRSEQQRSWLWDEVQERVLAEFTASPVVARNLSLFEHDVTAGIRSPGEAAEELISLWQADRTKKQ
jgi:LAO/AO transport system kinase